MSALSTVELITHAKHIRSVFARCQIHPFLWDVGLTTAAGLLIVVSALAVVSLVGRWMGAAAVGEYLLVRRVSNWLSSGAQVGLGVALPRYVAQAVDREKSDRLAYLISALASLMVVALSLALLMILGKTLVADWFFGNASMMHLVVPLAVLVLGQAAHTGVYGYYRGRLEMNWANGLQIVNVVLLPIACVLLLYQKHDVAQIVLFTGGAMFLISLIFLVPAALELLPTRVPALGAYFIELLGYGFARVPGDFAIAALAAVGPVFASHYLPITEVSRLLLGLGILIAISIGVKPCSTILLSKISMMMARGRMEEVRFNLEHFMAGVLELSVFTCLQCVALAPALVRIWVGPEYLQGVKVIQITLLSIPFYLFFVALRSAIDAAAVTAHNARNSYMALSVLLTLCGLSLRMPRSWLLASIACACVAGHAVLAWRTDVVARKLFGLQIGWRRSALPLLAALLFGGLAFLLQRWLDNKLGLLALILIEAAFSLAFVHLSRLFGSTWLAYFWDLLIIRKVKVAEQVTV